MAENQPSLLQQFIQDDISQELKDLVSTLPMEKGWTEKHLYKYQGFWHNPRILQSLLTCQNHFQANDTDIFLVTIPKSGTTWIKALTFAIVNRKRYIPNFQNHPLVTNNPHALVPFLELDLYSNEEFLPDLNSVSTPRILSTHFPYASLPKSVKKNPTCKIVYLCRDPKDTFVSHFHFANKVRKGIIDTLSIEEAFEMFCGGISPSGPFWDHMLGYWSEVLKRPEKVMFVKFEELKMRPNFVLKELAKFLGCPFSKEEEDQGVVDDISRVCSFDNLSKLEVNVKGKMPFGVENKLFFRVGQVGDWKNHLTVEMIEKLDTVIEEKLGEHGIQF